MDKKDKERIVELVKSVASIKSKYDQLSAKYCDTGLIAAAKAVCKDAEETADELDAYTSKLLDLIAPSKLDLADWNIANGKRIYFFRVSCRPYYIDVCYDFAESSKVAKNGRYAVGFTADDINVIGLHIREELGNGSIAYSDTRTLHAPIDVSGERTVEEWSKVKNLIVERKAMASLAVRAFKLMLETKQAELQSKLAAKIEKAQANASIGISERCSQILKDIAAD